MKKSKKILSNKKLISKISLSIILGLIIFLVGSVYFASNFGTGPLSVFVAKPSINKVADYEDPLANAVQKKANEVANLAATKVAKLEQTIKDTKTSSTVKTKAQKDLAVAQANEIISANVSALASNANNIKPGSTSTTGSVNAAYNALKSATETKLLENKVIIKGTDSYTINSTKIEELKDQFVNTSVKAGSGTCGTNGAPVMEGAWVSTGHPLTVDGKSCDSGAACPARECMKCGKNGDYEGSQTCSSVLAQGMPVVLPQQAGGVYTGLKDDKINLSSCFYKVNGVITQIAIGQKMSELICSPNGSMQKINEISADSKKIFETICKMRSNNYSWDNNKGECVAPTANNLTNTTSDGCNYLKPIKINNICYSVKDASALKELDKIKNKNSFKNKSECDTAISTSLYLECYPVGPIGSQTYAIRINTSLPVSYITCEIFNTNSKKVVSTKIGCNNVEGSIEWLSIKNTKNPSGKLLGGEVVSNEKDCRYGASTTIYYVNYKLTSDIICNDFTGELSDFTKIINETGSNPLSESHQDNNHPNTDPEYVKVPGGMHNPVWFDTNDLRYDGSYCEIDSQCREGSYCRKGDFTNAMSVCTTIEPAAASITDNSLIKSCSKFGGLFFDNTKCGEGEACLIKKINGKNGWYCGADGLSSTSSSSNSTLEIVLGNSCSVLGIKSQSFCGNYPCVKRNGSDNSGRTGYFCADANGKLPSLRVDNERYTFGNCKSGLPSNQECHHYDGTNDWYRSYIPKK